MLLPLASPVSQVAPVLSAKSPHCLEAYSHLRNPAMPHQHQHHSCGVPRLPVSLEVSVPVQSGAGHQGGTMRRVSSVQVRASRGLAGWESRVKRHQKSREANTLQWKLWEGQYHAPEDAGRVVLRNTSRGKESTVQHKSREDQYRATEVVGRRVPRTRGRGRSVLQDVGHGKESTVRWTSQEGR